MLFRSERNAKLKKIVEFDPLSTERKMAEADVAGALIRSSRRGEKAFSRLIQFDPNLRDASRLYFSKILFGKEAAPTVAQLRTFLKDYEAPLRQSGLYSEFRDLRAAKDAAARSIETAKEQAKGAGRGIAEAKETAKAIGEEARQVERLRKKQSARVAEALKTAEPIKDLASRLKRIEKAETKFGKEAETAGVAAEKQAAVARNYEILEKEISSPGLSPKQVADKVEATASDLRKKNLITEDQYDELLGQISVIKKETTSSKEAKDSLIKGLAKILKIGLPSVLAEEVVRRSL